MKLYLNRGGRKCVNRILFETDLQWWVLISAAVLRSVVSQLNIRHLFAYG